jgi:hypothetical protein
MERCRDPLLLSNMNYYDSQPFLISRGIGYGRDFTPFRRLAQLRTVPRFWGELFYQLVLLQRALGCCNQGTSKLLYRRKPRRSWRLLISPRLLLLPLILLQTLLLLRCPLLLIHPLLVKSYWSEAERTCLSLRKGLINLKYVVCSEAQNPGLTFIFEGCRLLVDVWYDWPPGHTLSTLKTAAPETFALPSWLTVNLLRLHRNYTTLVCSRNPHQ